MEFFFQCSEMDVLQQNIFPDLTEVVTLIPDWILPEQRQFFKNTLSIGDEWESIDKTTNCFELLTSEDTEKIHLGLVRLRQEYKQNQYFSGVGILTCFEKLVPIIINLTQCPSITLITFEALQLFNTIFYAKQFYQYRYYFLQTCKQNQLIKYMMVQLKSPHRLILRQAIEAYRPLFQEYYSDMEMFTGNDVKLLFELFLGRVQEFDDFWLLQSLLYFLISQDIFEMDPLRSLLMEKLRQIILSKLQEEKKEKMYLTRAYIELLSIYAPYYRTNFLIDRIIMSKLLQMIETFEIQYMLHCPLFMLFQKLASVIEFRKEILEQKYFDRINFNPKNPLFAENIQNMNTIFETMKIFIQVDEFDALIVTNKQFVSRLMSCRFNQQTFIFMTQFINTLANWAVNINIFLLFAHSKDLIQILKSGLLSKDKINIKNSLSVIYDITIFQKLAQNELRQILKELNSINLKSILIQLISQRHMLAEPYQEAIERILNVLESI